MILGAELGFRQMDENVDDVDDDPLLFGIVPDWFVIQNVLGMWLNYNDNSVLNPWFFISWKSSWKGQIKRGRWYTKNTYNQMESKML